MSTKKKRSYAQLINRLSKTLNNTVQIFTLDHIKHSTNQYPFQKILLGVNNPRRVLISAGIHGDEPAGIEAICSFLENGRYKVHLDQWEITILPCINPYGFENDTRENHENKDLNRLFKDHKPPHEVQLAKSIFIPSYFDISIELHEDCDSHGYYLFQKSNNPNGHEIGVKIIEALKGIISINFDKAIQEDFFSNYKIEKLLIRNMAKGETAWEICNEIYAIPFWLLASYNPGKDINSIPVGEPIVVPIISPAKSS